MKILYLSNLYYPQAVGGAERIAQALAETMAARGHQVSVVTLCERGAGRTDFVNGVKVIYAPIPNVYQPSMKVRPRLLRMVWHLLDAFNPVAAHAVGRIVDAEGPDLVHTHNVTGFSAAVWSQVRMRQLPCVHTMYDYYLQCPKTTMFRRGHNCRKMCEPCRVLSLPARRAASCLSAAVAVSRSVLERHRSILKRVPIRRVIHNTGLAGLKNGFETISAQKCPIRLGYLGRLHETKGVELLLSEFQRFHRNNCCELVIGGTGTETYVHRLKSCCQNSAVSFLGFVDPDWFMKQVDLLVVPSLWNDPFPTVVLQALAKGVAVVGARRGGIPEIIKDGENGVLFEPTVRGDLARALGDAMRMGLASAESRPRIANSVRNFTLARMCDRYEHLYNLLRWVARPTESYVSK